MKFTEILEELRKGKKVTREKWEEWKTECYKYIKLEHGEIIAYLKDDTGEDKVEERTKCMFELVDFNAEDWKIYEEKPTRIWKPEFGEKYYYITTSGDVAYNTFNTSLDEYRLSFRNVFKTAEEAKFVAKKLSIIKRLENLASNSLDWKGNNYKYFIFYDCKEEKVSVASDINDKYLPFSIYFRSKESCENAIKAIGERNLKKYYFDIKDNQ